MIFWSNVVLFVFGGLLMVIIFFVLFVRVFLMLFIVVCCRVMSECLLGDGYFVVGKSFGVSNVFSVL